MKDAAPDPEPASPRTLVLALGNPILRDDAVGWVIADRLEPALPPETTTVLRESGATLDLLARFQGFDRLVVVDAIQLGEAPVGTLYRLKLDDLRSTIRHSSAHDINFATAFEVGAALGYRLPTDVTIYAIEVAELRHFGEGLTPALDAAIPALAAEIAGDLIRPPPSRPSP